MERASRSSISHLSANKRTACWNMRRVLHRRGSGYRFHSRRQARRFPEAVSCLLDGNYGVDAKHNTAMDKVYIGIIALLNPTRLMIELLVSKHVSVRLCSSMILYRVMR